MNNRKIWNETWTEIPKRKNLKVRGLNNQRALNEYIQLNVNMKRLYKEDKKLKPTLTKIRPWTCS